MGAVGVPKLGKGVSLVARVHVAAYVERLQDMGETSAAERAANCPPAVEPGVRVVDIPTVGLQGELKQ